MYVYTHTLVLADAAVTNTNAVKSKHCSKNPCDPVAFSISLEKVNLSDDHQCVQPPLTNVLDALRALPAPQVSAQVCKIPNQKEIAKISEWWNCKNWHCRTKIQRICRVNETCLALEVWKNWPFPRLSLSSDPQVVFQIFKNSSIFETTIFNVQSIHQFVMSQRVVQETCNVFQDQVKDSEGTASLNHRNKHCAALLRVPSAGKKFENLFIKQTCRICCSNTKKN